MTNHKRKLHHVLNLVRRLNYFVLLGACLLSLAIAVFGLRHNNQEMVKLRTAVFVADEKNGDIEKSLRELRSYVYAHMNTNLASGANAVKPPIQLKYTYERLMASNASNYQAATAKVLDDAQNTCIAQYPGNVFSQPRLDCAKTYAASHPVTQKTIPDDLYKFDFVSPGWTPDMAGWSLVVSGLFMLIFILRFLSTWAIKHELQN
jgi:hypothetical protein